jgi:hypothetical protein
MSKSTRSKLICFFLIFALLLVDVPVTLSQGEVPVSQETILTFVHDFLQVFYPELFEKDYRLTLCVSHPANSTWREIAGVYFTVTAHDVNPLAKGEEHSKEKGAPIVLEGRIWLPPVQYGRVHEMSASSQEVHEQQLRTVQQLVESHPEWSNTQVASALKQAGARFGPSDQEAFVNSLPLNKAEKFLGKLKITSVSFNYPDRRRPAHSAASALDWTVQAEAELPDGTHPHYGFGFEPFEGKLTSVVQSLDR